MKSFTATLYTSFIAFIFLSPLVGTSQDANWGIGFLEIGHEIHSLNLYDAPHGTNTGTLGKESLDDHRLMWREEGPSLIIPPGAFQKINMDLFGLIVFQEQDGFIKIFSKNGEQDVWISLIEVSQTQTIYRPWIKYMTGTSAPLFALNYGMNVREQPDAKATKIVTAKGEKFNIEPTGRTNGLWAEVIIKEYDNDYCSKRNLIKEYQGWMKILDNEGYPNIWFGGYCC